MKKMLFILIAMSPLLLFAQTDSVWVMQHYTKKEMYLTMRDGVRLYTTVYSPKDETEKHPILINRTPYGIFPYGKDFRAFWSNHWMNYLKENYIIVLQDVRGRYMSEGNFVDVRPYVERKLTNTTRDIDEASDTYDTIDWLVNNLVGNNGNVGVFGSSYPGFYSTMAAICGHPALKATSPQAPVTDWFMGDDFHHNGVFMMADAFNFYTGFGRPRPIPTTEQKSGYQHYTKDNYQFYLSMGTLADIARIVGDSITFWQDLYAHPNYDAWWQARNARNFVQHIPPTTATLIVGGLYDAEDCFGAWNLYKAIDKKAKNTNRIVMGPWVHGGWYRGDGAYIGNIRFGSKTSEWYQAHVEIPYFNYYLKGKGDLQTLNKATIFFSGVNEWRRYPQWPPAEAKEQAIYFGDNGALSFSTPKAKGYDEYMSDPARPVPYTADVHMARTREYMTDDQRFASRRPDVLVYQTDTLTEDLTLAGPVVADLFTSISTTDADFVVKVIDVFPDYFQYNDSTDGKGNGGNYPMGGYQMLVRGEIMRGRYRNSFEKPEGFKPGAVTEVKYTLPDVAHVFKKGHRLMVQVQSSWFPLADRNPQQFVNIYTAKAGDFVKSNIKVYHEPGRLSRIILPVLK